MMWPAWVLALCAAPIFLLLRSLTSFLQNYRTAKKTGLPIIYSPISSRNPIWMILAQRMTPWLRKAPFGLGSWAHYTRFQWIWYDRDEMHQKLGKVFVHVSPGNLDLYSIDLEVIRQVYARRKAFERSQKGCDQFAELLKPSVSSANGAEWQRQRRITAPPFNERNMNLVWHESLRQTDGLGRWWESHGGRGFKSSCTDTMTLALNVLATAGLGHSWAFVPVGQKAKAEDEFSATYRDSLAPLLSSIVMISLMPRWMYDHGPRFAKFLPKKLSEHILLAKQFRGLMSQLVEERRAEIKAGKATDNIFLNAIIAKSDEMQHQLDAKPEGAVRERGLSKEELLANMFDYNIAGHETTAHTLNYCFHILAVEPRWQDWLQEEIDRVYPELPVDPATLDYEENFYRLKRCLALMLEMLRLFPPVTTHQKEVMEGDAAGHELRINGRSVFLPLGAKVFLPALSAHLWSEYWGPDSHEWKPSRWIQTRDGQANTTSEVLEAEELKPPPVAKESFLPWSLGARDCPGKKFSQVEFVAVVSYLLRHYRLEAIPLEGETAEDMRRRMWEYTRDSVPQITINFREPDKYGLRLVKRKLVSKR